MKMDKLIYIIADEMIHEGYDAEDILDFMCRATIIEEGNLDFCETLVIQEASRKEIFDMSFPTTDGFSLFEFAEPEVVNEIVKTKKLINHLIKGYKRGSGDKISRTSIGQGIAGAAKAKLKLLAFQAGKTARVKALKKGLSGGEADKLAKAAIDKMNHRMRNAYAREIKDARKIMDIGKKVGRGIKKAWTNPYFGLGILTILFYR
jgi:hypothetical protein